MPRDIWIGSMTFVSHAQNFEDVMLWRALKHITQGFYIDVGANDPEVDSVTKAFYDRGWRGINIEPAEVFFLRLQEVRQKDVNLRLVAAQAPGKITFHDVADTGLSTTERSLAERHRAAGYDVVEIEVEAVTLARICQEYVRGDVHFLKIDVEGGTLGVAQGLDLDHVRPWIILVEATEPMTQVADFASWEPLITDKGYAFVYYDGLNRFYVANEHADLAEAFNYPPNVFDKFSMAATDSALRRAFRAERDYADAQQAFTKQLAQVRAAEERAYESECRRAELQGAFAKQLAQVRVAEERAYESECGRVELQGALDKQTIRVRTFSARLREREDQLRAVLVSRSWRITAPLRALRMISNGQPPVLVSPCAEARPPRPTIFIECTHTYHSDLNTGIQRVVRNILRNAPTVARDYGYDVVPVIVEAERFRFADVTRVIANKLCMPLAPSTASPLSKAAHGIWLASLRWLAPLMPPSGRAFLLAPPDRVGLARSLKLLFPFHRLRRQPASADVQHGLDDFDRCDGSILLLLDSSWTVPIWPGARRFKERGGMVLGIVYDLIPITHSHTSVPELAAAFKAWLGEHLRVSDAFICISRSVAEMLVDYIRGLSADKSVLSRTRIDHFHLGSELDFIEPDDPVRTELKDIFTGDEHVFLMVGTIEPRKMHTYVLDAFDRFWAQGGVARLVIVGRQSWKMDEFLERVAAHPQNGSRLFLLRDVTDAELDHCYCNASSLVIASEVEGFGLPVVEAFQRGLPVICSDIPVFREIADGRAVFFSLADSSKLTVALDEFCRRVPLDARRERVPQGWIGWRESTGQLLDAIMRIQQHPRLPA